MTMTKDEKARVNEAAAEAVNKLGKNAELGIANIVRNLVTKYKEEGNISKKTGKPLTGLPARKTNIYQLLSRQCGIDISVAYRVLEIIGQKTGRFTCQFSPFGTLLYLSEDKANAAQVDLTNEFEKLFKPRK